MRRSKRQIMLSCGTRLLSTLFLTVCGQLRLGCEGLCIGFVALSLLTVTVAHGEPEVVREGIPHDSLYDVSRLGDSLLAVGDFGLLLVSNDGGQTWRADSSLDTEFALLGSVLNDGGAIVVGQMGFLATLIDDSWLVHDAITSERLLAVDSNANGLTVAVGGFGTALVSTDGGGSWSKVIISELESMEYPDPHLYDVHVSDDGVVTVVGEFSIVLQSHDSGESWEVLHQGESSLFSLYFDASGDGYAVGQKGALLHSPDGRRWNSLQSGSDANFLDVVSLQDSQIVVSGMGVLQISEDRGDSWINIADKNRDFETGWYHAIAVDSNAKKKDSLILAGHQGRIIRLPMDWLPRVTQVFPQ